MNLAIKASSKNQQLLSKSFLWFLDDLCLKIKGIRVT